MLNVSTRELGHSSNGLVGLNTKMEREDVEMAGADVPSTSAKVRKGKGELFRGHFKKKRNRI
jgi:hypothetical protein